MEAIEAGTVSPVVFESNGRYRGFALLSIYAAGNSERSLYIAALYGERDKTDEERESAMRHLERTARLNGCQRLTFNSTRKGWGKVAAGYGFRRSPYTTYERGVS